MFLLAIIASSSILSPFQEKAEEAKDFFPKTEEAIEQKAECALREFERALEQIVDYPEPSYGETLEKLQRAGRKCLVTTSVLHEAHAYHTEPSIIEKAKDRCFSLVTKMTTGLAFHEKLREKVKALLPKAGKLTKRERDHLNQVLTSMGEEHDLGEVAQFQHRRGIANEAQPSTTFNVLTFNVCGLFEDTPLIFGGVLPWRARVDRIAETIANSDADVVCLQEVFDEDLEELLFQKLQEKYAHFFTVIAPRYLGFKPNTFGVRSGLMVFCKHPIANPAYDPIPAEGPYVNRGLFSFDIAGKMKVSTTHLVAFQSKAQRKKRLEQMQAISHILQSKGSDLPTLLCGDLNIAWRSGEPAEEYLCNEYDVDLDVKKVTQDNCTYCDFTNFHWRKIFTPKYTILDYVLHLKESPPAKITTRRVNTWGEKPPYDCVSDHMGVIANVSLSH